MIDQKITFDKFIRWTITAVIVVAVVLAIDYLSAVLLPFAIAWFIAYLMYPLVIFFERKVRIRVRALSIIAAILTVIVVFCGIICLIIPPMLEQFGKFSDLVIAYLHEITNTTSFPDEIKKLVRENSNEIEEFLDSDDFSNAVAEAVPDLFRFISKTWNVMMSIIASFITLLYMFFILLDYEYLSANWIKIFPKSSRHFWKELTQDAGEALNNYVRGQCMVAFVMGVLFCIGFSIIGFPMAIGLGILIGILDLVPYLHTFALIPTAFLAGLKAIDTGQNYWVVFGSAVIVFCVVQVIIDMVVVPKIMGKQMGLNPAILLLSLSVWGALLGFLGLIIALPLTTIIITYWGKYVSGDKNQESNES